MGLDFIKTYCVGCDYLLVVLSNVVEGVRCARALLDGDVTERDAEVISTVIARLGVADVRAFGLAWEDCEELLRQLGFAPRVKVVAAG